MYIYIYICMYKYMYIYIYMYMCIYIYDVPSNYAFAYELFHLSLVFAYVAVYNDYVFSVLYTPLKKPTLAGGAGIRIPQCLLTASAPPGSGPFWLFLV